ncbi:peptidoglycan DD-metalloendopeptidase family protein [Microlunatus elymi]|uniref:Peptidoglycan DD-metalloendopeptidase family protein n=1 Tax=Microlunatus elymi TaxID=2596828 RepID=A0A516PWR6_9ACTN|nr:M23 family metallopeptidase [Microlunatus elymi]QDP95623.1 peptidoglycan DD-metalloendopeptidase family protein [Microlunatus elymi]
MRTASGAGTLHRQWRRFRRALRLPHLRALLSRWVRVWLPAWFAAVLIAGAGVTVAAITDLTAPPRSAATQQVVRHPAPLAQYDRNFGAAPQIRLNTPAQNRLVAVQRHYQLAGEQQIIAETALKSYAAERRRALRQTAARTQHAQEKIFAEREQRRIRAMVARELAERLRREQAAAEAEAARQRAAGAEPPADAAAAGATASLSNENGTTQVGTVDGATPPGQDGIPFGRVVGGVMPVASGTIGARFGAYGFWSSYHTGVDFRAGFGEPVHAVAAGVVTYAGNSGDWAGNHVAIRHADGVSTMYSHLSDIEVSPGQPVAAGQEIGRVGQTGRAFGPHLHFEVYPPGIRPGDVYRAVDPLPWLNSIGVHPR